MLDLDLLEELLAGLRRADFFGNGVGEGQRCVLVLLGEGEGCLRLQGDIPLLLLRSVFEGLPCTILRLRSLARSGLSFNSLPNVSLWLIACGPDLSKFILAASTAAMLMS